MVRYKKLTIIDEFIFEDIEYVNNSLTHPAPDSPLIMMEWGMEVASIPRYTASVVPKMWGES